MKRINIVIDMTLLEQARKLTGLKTDRDVVDFALRDLISRGSQRRLLELRGKIRWEGDLDEMRRTRVPD